jgi:hypothetical protein
MSPVGPEQASSVQLGQGQNGEAAASYFAQFDATGTVQTGSGTLLTASNKIVAKTGGAVRLNGSFLNAKGEKVYYDLKITVPAGALTKDQTITITIDKTSFGQIGDCTFGPSGLVFKTPATLYLWGSNVDIAKQSASVTMVYWDGSKWVPYPDSWGFYNANYTGIVFASGKIPHFSRYAFAR